jgi:hypothetical protein
MPQGALGSTPGRWTAQMQRVLGPGIIVLPNAPSWQYVNVRKLGTFIETSISGLQPVVFQSHNAAPWSQLVRHVASFLSGLEHKGLLASSRGTRMIGSPLQLAPRVANAVRQPEASSEAYFVKYDADAHAQNPLPGGVVASAGRGAAGRRLIVGFAPRRLGEFMILVLEVGVRKSK